MIVSPPKAGKTTVLKNIANSITHNFPEAVIKVRADLAVMLDEKTLPRFIQGNLTTWRAPDWCAYLLVGALFLWALDFVPKPHRHGRRIGIQGLGLA